MRKLLVLAPLLALAACGPQEFELPETREEQLELLSEKEAELRALRAQIAQLEEATGEVDDVPDSRLVLADSVALTDFRREIELQATVESDEVAVVTVEVPGRVSAVLVEEGDRVRRGQTLARVDLGQFDLQEAELQTQLSLARDILARQERLRAQNIGTEVQYLEAKNAVERLEKSIAQIGLQQGKSAVTAPIAGTVENKTINPGEYAAPGQPLMRILDAATVKVVADVPEVYLKSVRRGQAMRITFPALDEEREARVTEISRTIDPANRTFQVELALPNRGGTLKPNMLASVYFSDYANEDVVVVPSSVILEEVSGAEYVFVAAPSDAGPGLYRAEKRTVTTGESDATRREVLSGVRPGEIIVTEGMRALTDGQYVRLQFADAGGAPVVGRF